MTYISYLFYLTICVMVMTFVAVKLRRVGRAYLGGTMKTGSAAALSDLVLVNFVLFNTGIIALLMKTGTAPDSILAVVDLLSRKVGWVLLFIGLFNAIAAYKIKVLGRENKTTGAVPETGTAGGAAVSGK